MTEAQGEISPKKGQKRDIAEGFEASMDAGPEIPGAKSGKSKRVAQFLRFKKIVRLL
jgi:hypothetical protein